MSLYTADKNRIHIHVNILRKRWRSSIPNTSWSWNNGNSAQSAVAGGTVLGGAAGGNTGSASVSGGLAAGVGFPTSQKFSLKFGNMRGCIYPEKGQTTPGIKLVLAEDCLSEKAKFFISDKGNLQHVETGFCVQPLDDELNEYSPVVIDEPCGQRWAFIKTSADSLKLAEFESCIQPSISSADEPVAEYLIFHDNCNSPESMFQIEGTVDIF